MIARLTTLVVFLSLSACGGGTNVLRGDEIASRADSASVECSIGGEIVAVRTDDQKVIRAYFDREGSLYPGLTVQTRTPDTLWASAAEPLRVMLQSQRGAAAWQDIRAELSVPNPDPTDSVDVSRAWARTQIAIQEQLAEAVDVATRLPNGDRRPLVLAVHGFNTSDDAECGYETLRRRIERHLSDRPEVTEPAYLYVMWDGLVNQAPLIWTKAQYNFPLVGQGLRRLLGTLPSDLRVRAVTHSSGGPVLAHALWDASGAESIDEDECTVGADGSRAYRDYLILREAVARPPTPVFTDLRVGLIVPASPASLFQHIGRGDRPGPSQVAIGFNDQDIVVNKINGLCRYRGNTCLSVREEHLCAAADQASRTAQTALFDFSFSRQNRSVARRPSYVPIVQLGEEHDFTAYMERDDMAPLLDLLFTDHPVEDETPALCDGVRREPFYVQPPISDACPALPTLEAVPTLSEDVRLRSEALRPGQAGAPLQ